ncbi:LPS-assembly protein LptD [Citrifermentans bremense]|uniref:LPS-assembly protein LptD n=1 Tax=Citrifermentans bremense TaxID=60035 RepID=A0A6S6LW01_9BACT|nr:LPS assembly protein LptD [Citrifermentans bremense]BCG46112.1 LPS-assembly protein LptD [Citrifermentans bremense]
MKAAKAGWLLTYLLLLAAPAMGEPAVPVDKEVTLQANDLSIDVPTQVYRAQGEVRITQDGLSLLADSVVYHRLTGEAKAQGGVLMERSGDTMKGDSLSLNLLSQEGVLLNGQLFVKRSNMRLRAERLEKTGPADYKMTKGSFTTCDGDKPSWRFEARQVKVTLEDFATAKDAVFYAGDVPVFYTPYLIFPANTERQSGLLLPRLGYSSKKGFYYDQPYYWAINPSQEATFDLDLESSRGVGAGVDYRYLRPHGSSGRLQAFGIYDTQKSEFRGEVDQRHLEFLTPRLTLASNIHLITDRRYFLDYGELSGEYNRQYLESTVSFDQRWERSALFGELRYTNDLEAPNNDTTLQRLPTVGFIEAGEKVGPAYFSMDSRFTNFQREAGATGQRLQLHPRLAWYAKPAGFLDLSLYGGYQQRMYNAQGEESETGWRQLGQADAGGTLSLPLERVYDGRLRHLLIPAVEYSFVQQRHDEDLPFFDYDDRVLGQNAARWSLTNVVTRKYAEPDGVPEYRDLLYLKLSQGYWFSGQRRDLLTLVDEGHRLTDLMLEGVITPVQRLSVALDTRYNTTDSSFSTANTVIELKGEGRDKAKLGYRHSRGEVDYLEAGFTLPAARDITTDMLWRYSADSGKLLESRYAVEYRRQCWSVTFTYSERVSSRNVPGEQQFSVNFTLAGIGSLGPLRAF